MRKIIKKIIEYCLSLVIVGLLLLIWWGFVLVGVATDILNLVIKRDEQENLYNASPILTELSEKPPENALQSNRIIVEKDGKYGYF